MKESEKKSERLEAHFSTRITDILLRFLKGLPKIWLAKIGAKLLLKRMPAYKEELALPSSDEIFDWIAGICQTPHRRPGTPEGHAAEEWVIKKLEEFGLENVTVDPVPITVWNAERWSLKVEGQEIPSFYVLNTGFTSPEGVTAPLIYVGTGTAKDFKKVNVTGKIVVAEVPFPYIPTGILMKFLQVLGASYVISDPSHGLTLRAGQYLNFVRQNFIGGTTNENAPPTDVYWQAYKQGAKAICLILRDQPSNSNSHYGPYDAIMKPIPGLWIGKYDGMDLREKATAGATATIVLEGTTSPGTMSNVWGVLPGMSDEIVLLTSHHDSPFKGATEDGAGVAQVFAQIKAWSSVPKEKRARTLVFVIDAGHFYGSEGASAFARDHADLMKKVKILVTLEHLGAKAVVEKERQYAKTDDLALTVMFTSNEALPVATVVNALKKKPAKLTVPIPSTIFAPAPTSDAAGYVLEAGVPVISWIGCPYYLLDAHDTLDKIAKTELRPICETVTELIKPYM